jgi:DNA invertase Pin-like site-specific DNA recombinase
MPSGSQIPCVIYAVKSSQDDHDAVPDQIRRCQAAIDADADRYAAGTYSEDAQSGFLGNRGPQLQAAMDAAVAASREHGKAELWVWHSSRLGRGSGKRGEARSLLRIHVDLMEEDVTLRSVDDDAMLRDEVVSMASKMANQYSDNLSKWVAAGKDREFAKGRRTGGKVPDGLLRRGHSDTNDIHYVRDPDRAPVIEESFRLALENHGDGEIARRLNAAGYRTSTGKAYYRRAVQDMLTNPTYCGRVFRRAGRRKGQPTSVGTLMVTPDDVETNVAPLVEPADFDAVQALRVTRDRSKAGRKPGRELGKRGGRPTTRYALAKLATCGNCGARMMAETSPYKRKDGTQARAYVCGDVKAATGTCNAPKIDAVALDAVICQNLASLFANHDEWVKRQSTGNGAEIARLDALAADLDAQVKAKARQVDGGRAMLVEHLGTPQADTLRATLTTLEADQKALEAERDGHLSRASALRAVDGAADSRSEHRRKLADAVVTDDGSGLMADVNAELRRSLASVIVDTREGSTKVFLRFSDGERESATTNLGTLDVDGRTFTATGLLEEDPLGVGEGLARLREHMERKGHAEVDPTIYTAFAAFADVPLDDRVGPVFSAMQGGALVQM